MDLFNALGKYRKIVKEEYNFNYKYIPLLNSGKNKKRKLSEIFRDNINIKNIKKIKILSEKTDKSKRKEINDNQNQNIKFISDSSFINKGSVLEEKFFLEQIQKKRKILEVNKNKIKGYFTKSQCPFCRNVLSETNKEKEEANNVSKLINLLTDPNSNYHSIRSCLVFNSYNYPLINIKINKYYSFHKKLQEEKYNKFKIYKNNFDKKIVMESELSKNSRKRKYSEIKREEIKTNNLYMVEKPLLTTVREKIYKNMRQRYKRPLRLIILESKNNHPIHTYNNNF